MIQPLPITSISQVLDTSLDILCYFGGDSGCAMDNVVNLETEVFKCYSYQLKVFHYRRWTY